MQSFFGTEIPGGSETDRQYTGKRQRTVSLKTKDVLEKVLNYAKHEPKIIEIACE